MKSLYFAFLCTVILSIVVTTSARINTKYCDLEDCKAKCTDMQRAHCNSKNLCECKERKCNIETCKKDFFASVTANDAESCVIDECASQCEQESSSQKGHCNSKNECVCKERDCILQSCSDDCLEEHKAKTAKCNHEDKCVCGPEETPL